MKIIQFRVWRNVKTFEKWFLVLSAESNSTKRKKSNRLSRHSNISNDLSGNARSEKPSLKTLSTISFDLAFNYKFVQISVSFVLIKRAGLFPASTSSIRDRAIVATFYSNPGSSSTSPIQYHTSHLSAQ